MSTKVQKWGNSLAVRLPKSLAERFRLRKGTGIELLSETNYIAIKRLDKEQARLDELVNKITSQNRCKEQCWGRPLGNELW